MRGTAFSTVIAALLWWWQLRASLREYESAPRRVMTSVPDRQGPRGQDGGRPVAPVPTVKLADQVARRTPATDVKSP
jgi:hypothetical protein